jgi:hypothetical protein
MTSLTAQHYLLDINSAATSLPGDLGLCLEQVYGGDTKS